MTATQELALGVAFDPAALPRHIAIIVDGYRRWAEEHRRPFIEGHRRDSVPYLAVHHGARTEMRDDVKAGRRDAGDVTAAHALLAPAIAAFARRQAKPGGP